MSTIKVYVYVVKSSPFFFCYQKISTRPSSYLWPTIHIDFNTRGVDINVCYKEYTKNSPFPIHTVNKFSKGYRSQKYANEYKNTMPSHDSGLCRRPIIGVWTWFWGFFFCIISFPNENKQFVNILAFCFFYDIYIKLFAYFNKVICF